MIKEMKECGHVYSEFSDHGFQTEEEIKMYAEEYHNLTVEEFKVFQQLVIVNYF